MKMWKRPFLYLFLSSSIGVLFGHIFFFSSSPFLPFVLLMLIIFLVLFFLKSRFPIFLLTIFSLALSLLMTYPYFWELRILKDFEGKKIGMTGRIVSIKGENLILDEVRIHRIGDEVGSWISLRNKVRFKLKERYRGKEYLKIGSWIFSEGELSITSYYPFLSFRSEFDRTSVIPFFNSITTCVLNRIGDLRKSFEEYLDQFEFGDVVSNVFFGGSIPEDRKDLLVKTGIYHFFVVSGLHVGIFSSFISSLLLFLIRNRKIALSFSILFVFIYGTMIGFSIPSLRACVVVSLFLFFDTLEYKQDPFNVLGLAGFILFLMDPISVLSWSFHLSFVSAGTYTLSSSPVGRGKNPILKILLSTSLATSMILPLTILYFGLLPLFSIPLSLLLSPVVFPYLISLSSLSFMMFSLKLRFLSTIFLYAMEPALDFLDLVLKGISKIPFYFLKLENPHLRVLLFFSISCAMAIIILVLIGKRKIP